MSRDREGLGRHPGWSSLEGCRYDVCAGLVEQGCPRARVVDTRRHAVTLYTVKVLDAIESRVTTDENPTFDSVHSADYEMRLPIARAECSVRDPRFAHPDLGVGVDAVSVGNGLDHTPVRAQMACNTVQYPCLHNLRSDGVESGSAFLAVGGSPGNNSYQYNTGNPATRWCQRVVLPPGLGPGRRWNASVALWATVRTRKLGLLKTVPPERVGAGRPLNPYRLQYLTAKIRLVLTCRGQREGC